jgi:lysophospholipase L1-like esterase
VPLPAAFVLPGVADPGSPGTLVLVSLVPPTIEPVASPGGPVNLAYPVPYHNLGIPGATVEDLLSTTSSGSNPFFDGILRGQGTAVAQAVSLQPTFVILWAGANDLLRKVTQNLPVTDPVDFEVSYRELVGAFDGLDPGMVIGNVPDVCSIPFVTTVPPFLINPTTREPILVGGQLVPLLGPDGPLALPGPGGPGDRVTLPALSLLAQGIGVPPPIGTGEPLPDAVVLNLAEQAAIAAGTEAINDIIATVAAEYGYPLVDAHAILVEAVDGLHVGGVEITTEFLVGGGIGLDGIHPTDLGHAILANAFIEAINSGYGSHIPLVDLRAAVLERTAP